MPEVVKYATNANGTWAIFDVDTDASIHSDTSIAVDSRGKVHIGYFAEGRLHTQEVKYATNASGVWDTSSVAGSGFSSSEISIALDTKDKVHISFDTEGSLIYATNASGIWQNTVIDTRYLGSESSIAVDPSDKIHISYLYTEPLDSGRVPKFRELRYATNTSGTWTHSIVDTRESGTARHPSIAVDSQGQVHIGYYRKSSFYDADNIKTPEPDMIFTWNEDLIYANKQGDSWNLLMVERQLDIANVGKTYVYGDDESPSLAVDSNGKVHLSYFDKLHADLKYATNAAGAWQTITIDAQGNVGEQSDIAVDGNGKVHIAYVDRCNGTIKYATNSP